MIGQVISHYRILEKLGAGGMGIVYKAEDTVLKRFVALKFLPPEFTFDSEAKQRFLHEAQAASALQHANLCTIHDIGETADGQSFICMDLYEGETLKDALERGPLPVDRAVDFALQICQGLSRAHAAGIVHRDIKPANIMVTRHGEVKILDFGLAKLAGQTRLTRTGTTLGTAAYMSPEQARGDPVDQRTDTWSLGVLLYEMFTGWLPFRGDNEQAVTYSILNEAPLSIPASQSTIASPLSEIILHALAKRPEDRYQTADQLLADLKLLRSGEEHAGTTLAVQLAGRKKRRRNLLRAGAAALTLFGLAIAWLILQPLMREEVLASNPIPIAIISFENQTGNDSLDYLRNVLPTFLATSLQESRYLSVTGLDRLRKVGRRWTQVDLSIIGRDVGLEICRQEGMKILVAGKFTKAGDKFITQVELLDIEHERTVKTASAKGTGVESLLDPQIDDIARQISQGVGLSEEKIAESTRLIKDIGTKNLEAARLYVAGREAAQRWKHNDAVRLLEAATREDTSFAAGYYALAQAYGQIQYETGEANALARAREFSWRATDRDRLMIEAQKEWITEGNSAKALQILQQLVSLYPRDSEARTMLGAVMRNKARDSTQRAQARSEYEKVLAVDPDYYDAVNALALIHFPRDSVRAFTTVRNYLARRLEEGRPFALLGKFFDHYGQPDSAAFYYEKALEVTPDLGVGWRLAYIYARRERYDKAFRALDRDFKQLQLTEGRSINSQVMKAGYLTWLGRLDSAQSLLVRIDSMALRLGLEGEIGPLVHAALADVAAERGTYAEARTQTSQSCALGRTQPLLVTYAHVSKALRTMIDGGDELYSAWIDTRQHMFKSAQRRLQRSHELFTAAGIFAQGAAFRWAVVRVEYLVAIDSVDTAIALAARALPRKAPCLCSYENFPDLMPSIMPFTHKGDVVALAWLRKGDLGNAIAEYELLTNPDSIGYTLIDPRWHYDLAQLYEHAGKKAKAVERYEKFLQLWKDADSDLPQPADARARLSKLKRG